MVKNRQGFRGYIFSRPFMGNRAPQHIQQMVIRDYCKRKNMMFLLSAVEYKMPGCSMVFERALDELDHIEGIVMYSIFMLPKDRNKRQHIYQRLLETNTALHAASEDITIASEEDIARVEDICLIHDILEKQPEQFEEKLCA